MKKEKEDRLEEIYFCFRYRCKRCPKARECEEKLKKEKSWKKESYTAGLVEKKNQIK